MTKLPSILTLAIISIFAISCDNINLSNSEFVGEYEMTTAVIAVYDNKEFDDNPIVKSNVTIYHEKNKLFVQTDHFGMPFVDGDNPTPIEENKQLKNDTIDSNIEEIVVKYSDVIIINGFIHSIVDGVVVKSLPIQVRKISNNSQLLMANRSKSFEVTLYDLLGECSTETFYFEYEPIFKQNETLTWELTLIPSKPIKDVTGDMSAIKYINILKKIN